MLLPGPAVDIEDTLAGALEAAARASTASAPPAPLPRSGSLASEDVAVWLGRAFTAGASGRLWLAGPDGERIIFLECGRPVLATSSRAGERLGAWLIRNGRLTPVQRDQALAEATASGRRLGAVLVDHGALKATELLGVLRAQQEEIVVASVAWEEGIIGFDPGMRAERSRIRLLRHPALLVREGLARQSHPVARWSRLGGDGQLLALGEGPLAAHIAAVLGVDAAQRLALARLEGQRAGEAAEPPGQDAGLVALAQTLWLFGALAPRAAGAGWRRQDRQVDGERILTLFERARAADYFVLLGVARDAGSPAVEAALERQQSVLAAAQADPDLGSSLADEMSLIAAVLEEAGRVLGDASLRARYRAALEPVSPPD